MNTDANIECEKAPLSGAKLSEENQNPAKFVEHDDIETGNINPKQTTDCDEVITGPVTEPPSHGCCFQLEKSYNEVRHSCSTHRQHLRRFFAVIFCVLWCAYLFYAIYLRGYGAVPIIVITCCVVVVLLWKRLIRCRRWKPFFSAKNHPCCNLKPNTWKWIRGCLYLVITVLIVVFVAVDTSKSKESLTSLGGLLFLLFIVLITSTNPFKVIWRPVLWGLAMQFILALLILRWDAGFNGFRFVGDQVKTFMEYSDAGAMFVFDRKNYLMHRFAFKVLPVVVFFSAVISVLYYWGVIQAVVETLATVLQYTMGTTAVESLAAAAHIFVGQLESSIMLKPFLDKLTISELHAVMATGFATIAGTVIAAYIEFGAEPEHLLAASFMSGPAALAIAKLSLPETEESITKTKKDVKLPKGDQRNVFEAASVGAANSVKLLAYIVVNIIAFLSILEFVNSVLAFLGEHVGVEGLSFQLICSYVFMPLAAIIGIPWEDTGKVGSLIGTKIFINEFIGYAELGDMIQKGEVQVRTGVIATYILCGFGSIQSLGIALGAFGAVAPSRRRDVAGYMGRGLIIGNIACFTTACIAGILFTEYTELTDMGLNRTVADSNTTSLHNGTILP